MNLRDEHQFWFDSEQNDWQRNQDFKNGKLTAKDYIVQAIRIGDLGFPSAPEWFRRDMEDHYRKGFLHGMAEAAEVIWRMHKHGYTRPTEIMNIINRWIYGGLMKWRRSAFDEEPLNDMQHPGFPYLKPWPEIKRLTHERDSWRCVRCGGANKLEAHHIEPVCEGGVAELDNLETLCSKCHDEQ